MLLEHAREYGLGMEMLQNHRPCNATSPPTTTTTTTAAAATTTTTAATTTINILFFWVLMFPLYSYSILEVPDFGGPPVGAL